MSAEGGCANVRMCGCADVSAERGCVDVSAEGRCANVRIVMRENHRSAPRHCEVCLKIFVIKVFTGKPKQTKFYDGVAYFSLLRHAGKVI